MYEENPGFSRLGGGKLNDLSDFEKIGIEDLQEKIADLEKHVKDLENEN